MIVKRLTLCMSPDTLHTWMTKMREILTEIKLANDLIDQIQALSVVIDTTLNHRNPFNFMMDDVPIVAEDGRWVNFSIGIAQLPELDSDIAILASVYDRFGSSYRDFTWQGTPTELLRPPDEQPPFTQRDIVFYIVDVSQLSGPTIPCLAATPSTNEEWRHFPQDVAYNPHLYPREVSAFAAAALKQAGV